jgi:DUF1009 family protein
MSGAPLGIIAGAGLYPIRIADAAAKAGRSLCIILIEGFAEPGDYARFAGAEVIPIGHVGRMQAKLRAVGARDLVLAGRVKRPSFLSLRFDAEGAKLAARLGRRALFGGDDSLLAACVALMREQGFNPLGGQEILAELLVDSGPLTRGVPDHQARTDIARGIAVVRALGNADVGQGCVVQQGMVLGLEAIEGTDAMLARCGELQREGPGGVLVKLMKPRQDLRVDMPVIGPDTIRAAAAAGLRGIAIEGRQGQSGTIVIDRDVTVAAAEAAGLFLLAIHPDQFLADFNKDEST